MICVYALVGPSSAAPGVTGVRRERLRRVSFPGLDAIVGIVPSAPRPTRAAIRRYDEVIRSLASRFPAILPSRFGTCMLDLEELTLVVRARRGSFVRALRLVRNRAQMTVRVFGVAPATPGPVPLTRRTRGSGAAYLRARADEAARLREVPGLAPLRAAVQRWVKAERVERHAAGQLAASVYHLIPRGAAAAYHRTLERVALADGVTTIVSGPWPPYAFTPGIGD